MALLGDRLVPSSSGLGIALTLEISLTSYQRPRCPPLWIVYGDPGPCRLGELVVHVVGLVQEQLQHQAVVRPGQSHFPHGNLERDDSQLVLVGLAETSVYFGAEARVESEAVSILRVREGVPVPV